MSEQERKIFDEIQKTYGSAFCYWGAVEFLKKLKEAGVIK